MTTGQLTRPGPVITVGMDQSTDRAPRLLTALLLVASFFPYPAVGLGNSVGLQIGQVLVWLVLGFAWGRVWRTASARALLLIGVPLTVAFCLTVVTGVTRQPEVAVSTFAAQVLALACLPVFGWLLRGRSIADLVLILTVPVLVHTAFVGYQLWSFRSGNFPFPELYTNPSFLSPAEDPDNYAQYLARPMGVFPEPSAMSAALGPWSALLLHHGLSGGGRHGRLALLVAICGVFCIAASRSVYLPALLLVCGVIIARSLAGRRSFLPGMILMIGGIAAVLVVVGPDILFSRVNLSSNTSASGRLGSIVQGLELPFGSLLTVLIGVGAGQVPALLAATGPGYGAVWSILVRWWAEGGLIAAAGITALLGFVWRRLRTGPAWACFVLWLVGVSITTSYLEILPMWLALAFVLDGDTRAARPGR